MLLALTRIIPIEDHGFLHFNLLQPQFQHLAFALSQVADKNDLVVGIGAQTAGQRKGFDQFGASADRVKSRKPCHSREGGSL
jgi:hypothetical protein